jgi:6,7-dimethyl-8-ribityllumazine synthase
MQAANQGQGLQLNGHGLNIGIVQARFNEDVTRALAQSCTAELHALGVREITHIQVPGALEVALALQALAERDELVILAPPWGPELYRDVPARIRVPAEDDS